MNKILKNDRQDNKYKYTETYFGPVDHITEKLFIIKSEHKIENSI